jgi:hypothetical protein
VGKALYGGLEAENTKLDSIILIGFKNRTQKLVKMVN